MKGNFLNLDSPNPTCCTGWDNCCNIIAIQCHDFAWAIHQVCTLSCNQTCWFGCQVHATLMQLNYRWFVYVTSSHMNFWLLCIFYAIKLWSLIQFMHSCAIELPILEWLHATSLQSTCVMACPCTLSELDCLCLQYVVIQQQLLTEELFSQLPIRLLLLHHCNSKWSVGFQPDCYITSIWDCGFVKKDNHPFHFIVFKSVS